MPGSAPQDHAEAGADQRLVVGQQDADHRARSSGQAGAHGEAAASARRRRASSPPTGATRSRIPTRPWPAPRRRCRPRRAVVGDLELDRVLLVGDPHRRARRAGVLERVGQRLLHDPVGGQVDAGRQRRRARPRRATSTGRPAARDLLGEARRAARAPAAARARLVVAVARSRPSSRRISPSACAPVARSRRTPPRLPRVVVEHRAGRRAPAPRSRRSRAPRRRAARARSGCARRRPPRGPAGPARARAAAPAPRPAARSPAAAAGRRRRATARRGSAPRRRCRPGGSGRRRRPRSR